MPMIHEGFETFKKGTFGNAGANLFVDANGVIRRIAEQDLNHDGYFDIVFPNSHGYIERGPTSIFTKSGNEWTSRDLPHDSCWKIRIADVDGDGYDDLIVANGENGVSSILTSYIYWGGKDGLTGARTTFATEGAYDAVAIDLTGNGVKDLVFTNAWPDHHFPGFDYKQKVFVQESPRVFRDATDEFNLCCNTIMSLSAADLTGNGYDDLILIGYKKNGVEEGIGYIYYNGPAGLAKEPATFETWLASGAVAADVFGAGRPDIITSGGNRVTIYRNRDGKFSAEDTVQFELTGRRTQFYNGRLGLDIADIDGDGIMELLIGSGSGIEIRKASDIETIWQTIPGFHCSGVKAFDFDHSGKMDIVACCYETPKTYATDSFIFHCADGKYSFGHVTKLMTHGAVNVNVADVDHDGSAEIYFCNTMYGFSQSDPEFPVFCYYGSEDCKYHPENRRDYPVDRGAYSYAACDFNNDGFVELAATSWDRIRLFQGTPDGPDPHDFSEVHDWDNRITGGIIFADLNRDGYLDMLMTSYLTGAAPKPSVTVFWGSHSGYSQNNSMLLPCVNDAPQGTVLADINNDGRYEILITTAGHYTKRDSHLVILYDPENGYPAEKQVVFNPGGTTGFLSLADMRGTGNLDLILPFYTTSETRVLPLRIFYNDGTGNFDFDNPLQIECESSISSLAVDLNRNGYPDLFVCCHRNDLGHVVDSLLFRNGPDGLDLDNPEKLLGYGPHDFTRNIITNMMDRSESEYYTSPAIVLEERYDRISWIADTPHNTQLRMRVRFAEDEAQLTTAAWSGPVENGGILNTPEHACIMQYQAEFFAPNGCGSPKLTRVTLL